MNLNQQIASSHRPTPLAAGYAEVGNYGEALAWQNKALKEATPHQRAEQVLRLQYFENQRPLRRKEVRVSRVNPQDPITETE